MQILRNPITKSELAGIAKDQFGNFVKAVADIGRSILAIGGELHADCEALLLEDGSRQEDLWGINIHPGKLGEERIEFNSMINVRPSQGNRSRSVENLETRERVRIIVNKLIV